MTTKQKGEKNEVKYFLSQRTKSDKKTKNSLIALKNKSMHNLIQEVPVNQKAFNTNSLFFSRQYQDQQNLFHSQNDEQEEQQSKMPQFKSAGDIFQSSNTASTNQLFNNSQKNLTSYNYDTSYQNNNNTSTAVSFQRTQTTLYHKNNLQKGITNHRNRKQYQSMINFPIQMIGDDFQNEQKTDKHLKSPDIQFLDSSSIRSFDSQSDQKEMVLKNVQESKITSFHEQEKEKQNKKYVHICCDEPLSVQENISQQNIQYSSSAFSKCNTEKHHHHNSECVNSGKENNKNKQFTSFQYAKPCCLHKKRNFSTNTNDLSKNSKYWRTKQKYMEGQEQINKIYQRKNTFRNFAFTEIERKDNASLGVLLNKMTDDSQKGTMNLVDLWPSSVRNQWLRQSKLDETKRLVAGIANGQSGIRLVKQKAMHFKKQDELKIIASSKNKPLIYSNLQLSQLSKKSVYQFDNVTEVQKQFLKIGLNNFSAHQEAEDQPKILEYLKQMQSDTGFDPALYMISMKKVKGRNILIQFYSYLEEQSQEKNQNKFQKYLQKLRQDNLTMSFSGPLLYLLKLQNYPVQVNLIQQAMGALTELENTSSLIHDQVKGFDVDEKKTHQLRKELDTYSVRLNKMMDKLSIIEGENINIFKQINAKTEKIEQTIFKNSKYTSWKMLYKEKNIKSQHQQVKEMLEQTTPNENNSLKNHF